MVSCLRKFFGRNKQVVLLPSALLFLGLSNCLGISRGESPHHTLMPPPGRANGLWQDNEKADYLVAIENERIAVSFHGQVRKVAKILGSLESRLFLCEDGQDSIREISLVRDNLTIRDPQTNEQHHLRRLPSPPGKLRIAALQIPKPLPVTSEIAQQVEGELGKRVRADQDAQKLRFEQTWGIGAARSSVVTGQALPDETDTLNMVAVKADNTKFLKKLVTEMGWIDSRRFGSIAADYAFLLAQHSQDLPLMLAALPKIKEEVETRRLEGDTYALLYDRIQLLLGEKQLYGTRMGKNLAGQPIVLPTVFPETVDERRKSLGMNPLSEYVKIFGANEVRFSSACTRITARQ
jgi:hypothetical protein